MLVVCLVNFQVLLTALLKDGRSQLSFSTLFEEIVEFLLALLQLLVMLLYDFWMERELADVGVTALILLLLLGFGIPEDGFSGAILDCLVVVHDGVIGNSWVLRLHVSLGHVLEMTLVSRTRDLLKPESLVVGVVVFFLVASERLHPVGEPTVVNGLSLLRYSLDWALQLVLFIDPGPAAGTRLQEDFGIDDASAAIFGDVYAAFQGPRVILVRHDRCHDVFRPLE